MGEPDIDTAPDWARIAPLLREMADLMDQQEPGGYRAMAYRRAADYLEREQPDLRTLRHEGGRDALEALPTIGRGMAAAIVEILDSGHWRHLTELRGDGDAEELFRTVPGVGAALSRQIHEVLGASSLEALEMAAHDGRLQRLSRVGSRRAAAIGAAVSQMLDRAGRRRRGTHAHAVAEPPVDLLLRADARYRADAAAGRLPKIAPRRFNPAGHAWLPVLHLREDGWRITALFSNTARAHRLERTNDWVVLYCEDENHGECQYTVVTALGGGALSGQRVVRGREAECLRRHWQAAAHAPPAATSPAVPA
jgi:DNA polymerase (family X)